MVGSLHKKPEQPACVTGRLWQALPQTFDLTNICLWTYRGRSLLLQDLFQHNAWAVRVAGWQAADSERLKKVDFSAFYEKFNKGGRQ